MLQRAFTKVLPDPYYSSTSTVFLRAGVNAKPSWSSVSLASDITGTLAVGNGGIGVATLTNHGVLIGQVTSAIVATAAGNSGQVLRSGGASADPGWSTATYPATAGTAANVLRSDGTNFLSAALAASDLSNGATGSGSVMLAASPTTTGTMTAAAISASGQITSTQDQTVISRSGATTNYVRLDFANTGGRIMVGAESSAGGAVLTGSTAYASFITSIGNTVLQLGANQTLALTISGANTSLSGTLGLKAYTVATLPAGTDGMVAFVTDALAPTFLGALTGGSTSHVPVFYDGGASAWKSF